MIQLNISVMPQSGKNTFKSIAVDQILNFTVCLFSKNESAGIAASIEAMAAGDDGPETSGNGSTNAADDSPSVR